MTEQINPIMYGVWIPGKGWVRGDNKQAFGDTHKEVAKELAKRLGQKAQVFYIDQALIDLEGTLLEAERNNTYSWLFGYRGIKR